MNDTPVVNSLKRPFSSRYLASENGIRSVDNSTSSPNSIPSRASLSRISCLSLCPSLVVALTAIFASQAGASLSFSGGSGGAPTVGGGFGSIPSSSYAFSYDIARGGTIDAYTGTFATSSYDYNNPLAGPYTGTGYAGQSPFFNQFTGGTNTPRVQMSVDFVGNIGTTTQHQVTATGGNHYDILIGNDSAIEEITLTYTYLGISGYYSPGITGITRNNGSIRPVLSGGIFSGLGAGVDAQLSGFGFPNFPALGAGTNAIFQASDFVSTPQAFTTTPFNDLAAPSALTPTSADFSLDTNGNGRAFWFHNGGDLGDLVNTVSVTFTPSAGTTFDTGQLRFSFDGMAPVIPEPSRGLLLMFAAACIVLRRRR